MRKRREEAMRESVRRKRTDADGDEELECGAEGAPGLGRAQLSSGRGTEDSGQTHRKAKQEAIVLARNEPRSPNCLQKTEWT